jgi:predicted O-methyltransferase YrrM
MSREGLEKDGQIITIDINEEIEKMAATYFEKAS